MNKFVCIILFSALALAMCKSPMEKNGYEVISSQISGEDSYNSVLLSKTISPDSVIEIARTLRKEAKKVENATFYFYQPGMSLDICWVSVSYKSNERGCNMKDKDGVCVEFREVWTTFVPAEELGLLKAKGFDRKKLLMEVVHTHAEAKYEIYGVSDSAATFVSIKKGMPDRVVPLKIKIQHKERRFFYDAPNIPGYFVLGDDSITLYEDENSSASTTLYRYQPQKQ